MDAGGQHAVGACCRFARHHVARIACRITRIVTVGLRVGRARSCNTHSSSYARRHRTRRCCLFGIGGINITLLYISLALPGGAARRSGRYAYLVTHSRTGASLATVACERQILAQALRWRRTVTGITANIDRGRDPPPYPARYATLLLPYH